MRRRIFFTSLIVLLVALSGCLGQQPQQTTDTDAAEQNQAPSVHAITPVQNVEPDATVNYAGNTFGAERVRISQGDVVAFHNPNSWNHTLNIQSEPLFFTISPGETVLLRFNRAGQYFGFCTLHNPPPVRISVE